MFFINELQLHNHQEFIFKHHIYLPNTYATIFNFSTKLEIDKKI